MKTSHTPTPFYFTIENWGDGSIYSLRTESDGVEIGSLWSSVIGSGEPIPGEANAEYIVRCVNAHEELVAALEGVLGGFDAGVFGRITDNDSDPAWAVKLLPHIQTLSAAYTALQKARGES